MIFFDISDTSVEAVQLTKSLLTGEAISAFARVEFKDGPLKAGGIREKDAFGKIITNLLKNAKPHEMQDQECAFTLPDRRVYIRRFTLAQRRNSETVLGLVKAQAEKIVPQAMETLIYRFVSLNHAKGEGEISFVAVPTNLVNGYVELFNKLNLQPRLIVPESLAVNRLLSPTIDPTETILYLDIGERFSNGVLMDKWGVVETFTKPVQGEVLLDHAKELLEFSRKRLGKKIDRIILGGGGSLKIDAIEAMDKLKVNVVSVETALKSFRPPIKVDFGGLPKILFVNVLGLVLLNKEKHPLNLLP